jgi:hypothetical protein
MMMGRSLEHDWEIRAETELEQALDSASSAADDCAAVCLEAIGPNDGSAGSTLRCIAGAALVAAECARAGDPDESREALSLCARIIDSASAELDRVDGRPGGRSAAESARSCAAACRGALILLYATS